MEIVRGYCGMCDRVTERKLDITSAQLYRYRNGHGLIQEIFPNLDPADREFIKTGMCADCQQLIFG